MKQKKRKTVRKTSVSFDQKSIIILRKLGYMDGRNNIRTNYGSFSEFINRLLHKAFLGGDDMNEEFLRFRAGELNRLIEASRKEIESIGNEVDRIKMKKIV